MALRAAKDRRSIAWRTTNCTVAFWAGVALPFAPWLPDDLALTAFLGAVIGGAAVLTGFVAAAGARIVYGHQT